MEIRANKTNQIKIGNRFENISDLDIDTINIVQEEHNERIIRSSKRVREQKKVVSRINSTYLTLQEKLLNAQLELAQQEKSDNFLKLLATKLRKQKQLLTNGRTVNII